MKLSIMLAVVVSTSTLAVAGPTTTDAEVRLEMLPPVGAAAPQIEATIVDGPRATLSNIHLLDGRGLSIPAESFRDYTESSETIAIAFVVEGAEYMMGNDATISAGDPSRYQGYFDTLSNALGAMDLGHTMPRLRLGMLVTYDASARVRIPMGPNAVRSSFAIGPIGIRTRSGRASRSASSTTTTASSARAWWPVSSSGSAS